MLLGLAAEHLRDQSEEKLREIIGSERGGDWRPGAGEDWRPGLRPGEARWRLGGEGGRSGGGRGALGAAAPRVPPAWGGGAPGGVSAARAEAPASLRPPAVLQPMMHDAEPSVRAETSRTIRALLQHRKWLRRLRVPWNPLAALCCWPPRRRQRPKTEPQPEESPESSVSEGTSEDPPPGQSRDE